MTNIRSTDTANTSLTRDLLHAAGYYLGNRRALLLVAAVAIVAGLTFNWEWLVAAGLAPILIAILPCAVMCALGLCMHKMSGSSSSSSSSSSSGGCCATDSSQLHETEQGTGNVKSGLSRPSITQDTLDCCHQTADTTAPANSEKAQVVETEKGSGALSKPKDMRSRSATH